MVRYICKHSLYSTKRLSCLFMLFFFNYHSKPSIGTQGQMPKDTWPVIAKAGNETWTLNYCFCLFFFFFLTYNLLVMLLFTIAFVDLSVVHDITQILYMTQTSENILHIYNYTSEKF